jgi:gamma-glutamyl-gamma-aminobutyrate hydrolase PuuD
MTSHALIAITQRADLIESYGETRDGLDQRWWEFMKQSGFVPLIIPNHLETAQILIRTQKPQGIILSGGNSLISYGGNSTQRDEIENFLINYSISNCIKLLGVCRGMQAILNFFKIPLCKTPGQIASQQSISINGSINIVNSYHEWGITKCPDDDFYCWAISQDGVIKAITSKKFPWINAIMWHPERIQPFRNEDFLIFKKYLQQGK